MARNNKVPKALSLFEQIKQIDTEGTEFWTARSLAQCLQYKDYRNFLAVVDKAKEACRNSGNEVSDHFGDITEMVGIGSSAERQIDSIKLSRYACYLIVQNADPSKEVIALGQSYFAIQTRKQELHEALTEEESKRLYLRREVSQHNIKLAAAAKDAGVETSRDYAVFQNHGYKGLYGGMTAQDIHDAKNLTKGQHILDHMGSTELAANLFRATQTEEKLRREGIQGKRQANRTHYEVGKKVRQTIAELGGTMPEHLPREESIKTLERKERKAIK